MCLTGRASLRLRAQSLTFCEIRCCRHWLKRWPRLQSQGRREGAALASAMLAQCEQIDLVAAQISARAPDLIASVERKLTERLEKALGPPLASGSS